MRFKVGDTVIGKFGHKRNKAGIIREIEERDGVCGRAARVHWEGGMEQWAETSDLRRPNDSDR